MGLFKKIISRVVTDGFEEDVDNVAKNTATAPSEEDTEYEYTGTTKISLKGVFNGGTISRYRTDPYKEIEDENDENYWWCYSGSEKSKSGILEIPYDPDTLKEVIRHLNEKIDQGDVPVFSIPQHLMQVMQLLSNDDFDYAEVTTLIEKSPALAGMFINSINSAFYSRGFAITDLNLALSRLGKNNIRALLQLYSIKIGFTGDKRFGKLAERIIHHSYVVAIVASYLSQRYFPDPSLAFLAGLLHDIGKLGILKELSLNECFCSNLKGDIQEYMFDRIFNNRHEKIGSVLGKKWNMDPLSLAAIEAHHNFWEYPFSEEDQLDYHLCLIINISDTIARILGHGRPIGKVNLFREPATIDLCIEKDNSTLDFLDSIPEVVKNKTSGQLF